MQTLHNSEVLAYTAQETAGNMSIGKTKLIGFSPARIKKEAANYLIPIQTERLIEYAKAEIVKLGNKIQEYNSRNHMDRTGNLLNSLCWGVYYQGKMKGSGFFRKETTQDKGIEGTSQSYLHEFFERTDTVNGRQMAQEFIDSYKGFSEGWTIFFAILAPYWGYWEGGFTMKTGLKQDDDGNWHFTKKLFMHHQAMTYVYDDVRMDLKPKTKHLDVYIPKYSYKNPRYKNKRGYTKYLNKQGFKAKRKNEL